MLDAGLIMINWFFLSSPVISVDLKGCLVHYYSFRFYKLKLPPNIWLLTTAHDYIMVALSQEVILHDIDKSKQFLIITIWVSSAPDPTMFDDNPLFGRFWKISSVFVTLVIAIKQSNHNGTINFSSYWFQACLRLVKPWQALSL